MQHVKKLEFEASAADLLMISPGQYKLGVRTQGSKAKLHSVFKEADFQAVIMDAPVVNTTRQNTSVKVSRAGGYQEQHATKSNNIQQGVQTDATFNIQQCWELLANNVASVCTGLKSANPLKILY